MRHNFLFNVDSLLIVEFFSHGDVNSALVVLLTGKICLEGCSNSSILGQIACVCAEYYGNTEIIECCAAILDHVLGTSEHIVGKNMM